MRTHLLRTLTLMVLVTGAGMTAHAQEAPTPPATKLELSLGTVSTATG
jgi:hypothetical protein